MDVWRLNRLAGIVIMLLTVGIGLAGCKGHYFATVYQTIGHAGGSIQSADQVFSLYFPPGAVTHESRYAFFGYRYENAPGYVIGACYGIAPDTTPPLPAPDQRTPPTPEPATPATFQYPVTLVMNYSGLLDKIKNENLLVLYEQPYMSNEWRPLADSRLDTTAHKVTATISGCGRYVLCQAE